jgi:hypothetical protein
MPAGRQAEGRERRGNRSEAELDEVNLFIFRDSDCHIPIVIGIRNDINRIFWTVSGRGVSCLYFPATESQSGHPDFAGPTHLMLMFGSLMQRLLTWREFLIIA